MNTWTHSKKEKLGILTVAECSGNDCTKNYIILLKFDRKTNVVDPDLVKTQKEKKPEEKNVASCQLYQRKEFLKTVCYFIRSD